MRLAGFAVEHAAHAVMPGDDPCHRPDGASRQPSRSLSVARAAATRAASARMRARAASSGRPSPAAARRSAARHSCVRRPAELPALRTVRTHHPQHHRPGGVVAAEAEDEVPVGRHAHFVPVEKQRAAGSVRPMTMPPCRGSRSMASDAASADAAASSARTAPIAAARRLTAAAPAGCRCAPPAGAGELGVDATVVELDGEPSEAPCGGGVAHQPGRAVNDRITRASTLR